MSDKLEALSQPVMWAIEYATASSIEGEYIYSLRAKKLLNPGDALYSQEYVTSLLAALEEANSKNYLADMLEWRGKAEAAGRREDHLKADVAVLGKQIAHQKICLDNEIKSNAWAFNRIREIEQQLASLPADWSKDSSLATWFPLSAAALEEKDQRIKELEGDVRFERLRLNETEIAALIQRADAAEQREGNLKSDVDVLSARNAELEQRLQQPIKLPDIRSEDYHESGWFQHMKYYRAVVRSIQVLELKVEGE
ncbi:hypothetical protein ABQ381_26535 [Serratia fonticola]|uniref:hypothetical protein n=1 Tax=Serratia fonticola TaxID=47917 RepID=UPI0027FE269E|nr:hypothetical protein [Serratia fonticola]MDQ7209065.1 hypothetical protein [Serratia fonticola]